MTVKQVSRMSKARLVDLILADAGARGRSGVIGGPKGWSHDELVRYVMRETDLVNTDG